MKTAHGFFVFALFVITATVMVWLQVLWRTFQIHIEHTIDAKPYLQSYQDGRSLIEWTKHFVSANEEYLIKKTGCKEKSTFILKQWPPFPVLKNQKQALISIEPNEITEKLLIKGHLINEQGKHFWCFACLYAINNLKSKLTIQSTQLIDE